MVAAAILLGRYQVLRFRRRRSKCEELVCSIEEKRTGTVPNVEG